MHNVLSRLTLIGCLAAAAHAGHPPYIIVDLGTLGGPEVTSAPGSDAADVNATGVVVGISVEGDTVGGIAAFRWIDGVMTKLHAGTGAALVRASAISNSNIAVGVARDLGDTEATAIRWDGATPVTLGFFDAVDVNDAGSIAGRRMIAPFDAETMAVVYMDALLVDLGTLGGGSSAGYAIDADDRVVGGADDFVGCRRPFFWDGVIQDLGTLGGDAGEARAIAAGGWIAGWSHASNGQPHATRWRVDAEGTVVEIVDLGVLASGFSYANGVDTDGRCVGTSDGRAFVSDGVSIVDLNDLLPNDSGWVLERATAIANGTIVGRGRLGGQLRAFLMRPADPADITADGVIDFADLLAILSAWGPCPACAEDIDGDGIVGLQDLLLVLSGWS